MQADGGKTVYIEFGPGRDKDDLCAKHEENPPRYNSWRLLKGKRVVIPGTVVIEPGAGLPLKSTRVMTSDRRIERPFCPYDSATILASCPCFP